MTCIVKISHTCTCCTSGDNITLKLFLIDNSLSTIINPKMISEKMFYWNSLKSVNFIDQSCYQMHLCFSFSLFLLALTNAESWRNGVLNLKGERRKET